MLAYVLIAVGLFLGWLSFQQAIEMRRFRSHAVRVKLRIAEVQDDTTYAGVGHGTRHFSTPTFEVADGPYRGQRSQGETGEKLYAVGQLHIGWFDPAKGQARLDSSMQGVSAVEWSGAGLAFVLLATGLAILF